MKEETKEQRYARLLRLAKKTYKIRKYRGDDLYSWALFVHGDPAMTGLSRHSAQFERDYRIKKFIEKHMGG